MKVVLCFIAAFATLAAVALVHEALRPTPVIQPSESIRLDRQRTEELHRRQAIEHRAYEECREQKTTELAIARCVVEKTT